MLREESPGRGSGCGGGILSWARACDTVTCTVYCLTDSAYLCSACDDRLHAANHLASCHVLSRVGESCERAPAAFLCKADAASLCAVCDAEVHPAKPLAHLHHRVPILFPSSPVPIEPPMFSTDETIDEEEEDEEAASWLLMDQGNAGNFLDLMEYSDLAVEDRYVDVKSYGGNGIVPVKNEDGEGYDLMQQQLFLGLEFEPVSKSVNCNGHTSPLSHSVSLSSMDMSVVPDSSLSDISVSHPRPPKGPIDLFSGPPAQVPVQLAGVDREARVLRYREKKKTRKFEKTIRYASRKAYAETRPRIKGRFAKRAEIDIVVDQMFSATTMIADASSYGIVPSF